MLFVHFKSFHYGEQTRKKLLLQTVQCQAPSSPVAEDTRQKSRRSRPAKRIRQLSSGSCETEPVITPGKRRKTMLPTGRDKSPPGMHLDILLQWLNAMSEESRLARQQMADEAGQAEMNSGRPSKPYRARQQAGRDNQLRLGKRNACSGRKLPRGPMKSFNISPLPCTSCVRTPGRRVWPTTCYAGTQTHKKMKSGYHMTINDQVHVQAQWPQLNIYRAANSIATCGCLSVKEFCTGYLTYIEDSLKGSKPKIDVALEYLSYLHELLDEVPLLGWEVVRDAHGEILRLVEQCRLKWEMSMLGVKLF